MSHEYPELQFPYLTVINRLSLRHTEPNEFLDDDSIQFRINQLAEEAYENGILILPAQFKFLLRKKDPAALSKIKVGGVVLSTLLKHYQHYEIYHVLIPFRLGQFHWMLLDYNPQTQIFFSFDSLGVRAKLSKDQQNKRKRKKTKVTSNITTQQHQTVKKFIQRFDRYLEAFVFNSNPEDKVQEYDVMQLQCPIQNDGFNCGIFTLYFIEQLIQQISTTGFEKSGSFRAIPGGFDPTQYRNTLRKEIEAFINNTSKKGNNNHNSNSNNNTTDSDSDDLVILDHKKTNYEFSDSEASSTSEEDEEETSSNNYNTTNNNNNSSSSDEVDLLQSLENELRFGVYQMDDHCFFNAETKTNPITTAVKTEIKNRYYADCQTALVCYSAQKFTMSNIYNTVIRLISHVPAICTHADKYVQLLNGVEIENSTAAAIRNTYPDFHLLTPAERLLAHSKVIVSVSEIYSHHSYDEALLVSAVGRQFNVAELLNPAYINTDNYTLNQEVYRQVLIQDWHLWLRSLFKCLSRFNPDDHQRMQLHLRVPPIGCEGDECKLANHHPIVDFKSTVQSLLLETLFAVLPAYSTNIPVVELFHFERSIAMPHHQKKISSSTLILYKAAGDICAPLSTKKHNTKLAILCPTNSFCMPGNSFTEQQSVETYIGNRSSLRVDHGFFWNSSLLNQTNIVAIN
jgi:hypothetical protein